MQLVRSLTHFKNHGYLPPQAIKPTSRRLINNEFQQEYEPSTNHAALNGFAGCDLYGRGLSVIGQSRQAQRQTAQPPVFRYAAVASWLFSGSEHV